MITKSTAYLTSTVQSIKTRQDIELMLDKQGIKQIAWMRDTPQTSYILFRKTTENGQLVAYKVSIPFIEKTIKNPERSWEKINVYDEVRSYRFFFHIFKSQMLNTEIGMTFEEMFSNYMVIGKQDDGSPMTVQEKMQLLIFQNKMPQLE